MMLAASRSLWQKATAASAGTTLSSRWVSSVSIWPRLSARARAVSRSVRKVAYPSACRIHSCSCVHMAGLAGLWWAVR